MAIWRVNNATLLGGEICSPWQTNHAYALGARCVCRQAYGTTTARAFVFEVTTAGTSHATTEPVWPLVIGNTVVDNGVTWTCRSPDDGNWDNASCILHYVLNHAAVAAGDFVYIDDGHTSPDAYTVQITIKGSTTSGNPIKIICVDKTDDSLSTGAVISPNGNVAITFNGYGYSYGVKYRVPNINSNIQFIGALSDWTLEGAGTTVLLHLAYAGASNLQIGPSGTGASQLKIRSGSIQFDNLAHQIQMPDGNGFLDWKGGSLVSATGVTKLFDACRMPHGIIEDVNLDDVGAGATATSLIDLADSYFSDLTFSRCKLPSDAGFTPTVGSWANQGTGRVRFHHCSSANKTYDFLESTYEGTVEDETTIIRDGGASDGATPISHKMISSAGVKESILGFRGLPIIAWINSGAQTITIEGIYDGATNLQDDEVALEVDYPIDGTSGLGGFSSTRKIILGTPVDLPDSWASWIMAGMANPNKFRLQTNITLGKEGQVTVRPILMKASTTIYIDPKIRLTAGGS